MVDWRTLTAGVQNASRSVFGTPVLYRVAGTGGPVAVRGIYRAAAADGSVDLEAEGAMVSPTLSMLDADLPAGALVGEQDTVEITDHGAALFRVHDFEPDGEGMTRLVLTETT